MEFNARYRPAFRLGAAWVLGLGLLAGLTLDSGECAAVWLCATLTYLAMLLLVLFRRPRLPTRTDLLVFAWSFPLLCFGGYMLYFWLWRMRGMR